MNIQNIKSQFEEYDIRCEEMHPMFMNPVTALGGRLTDVILEHDFDQTLDAMGIPKEGRDDIQDRDDLADLLHEAKLHGYLAQFAKPIARPFGENGAYSSSWGYYRTQWFYASSVLELSQKAIEWAKKVFDEDMQP